LKNVKHRGELPIHPGGNNGVRPRLFKNGVLPILPPRGGAGARDSLRIPGSGCEASVLDEA
jgi:hypothetical protein